MRISKEQRFAYFAFAVILLIVLACLFGCKKESAEKYEVTYTFSSQAIPCTIQIWDITGKNDISETISTPSYSKVVTYDYRATYRARIESQSPSKISISITYDGSTNTCSDSLFSTLECFRDI